MRTHWRAELIFVGLIAVSAFGARMFLPQSASPYLVGAIVASGGWWLYVIMLQTGGAMNKQVGVMAEEWTVGDLRKLRKHGWRLVNHVMLERVDIDHALIGPGGFFAIETKYRTDWHSAQRDFAAMARRAAESARRLEPRMGLRSRRVSPLIVMWGPNIADEFNTTFEEQGVTFCPGKCLADYFRGLTSDINEDEVKAAYEKLILYVNQRDKGENATAGPQPRSIDQTMQDFIAVASVIATTLWALTASASIAPKGLWVIVVAAAMCGTAVSVRRRWSASVRTRLVSTAIVTIAIGASGLVTTVLTIQLLT
jgi:hypothetical protein